MSAEPHPQTTTRTLRFACGTAIGMSHRWIGGQYCSILTPVGLVGCGIYDVQTAATFDQAVAIARGTPEHPLCEPEDLYESRIVDCTPKAREFGILEGMSGREAVNRMLQASPTALTSSESILEQRQGAQMSQSPIQVRRIDHVTLVVKSLAASRAFYVDLLGMEEVSRPGFRFPGLWFQAGTTQIHLIEEHTESGPARVFIPETCEISRTHHFAFEVDDAFAATERLRSLGVPIAAGPKQRPDGPTQVYIQDPDAHLVELYSYRR